MQGVASILDPEHTASVEALWQELEHHFGLSYACVAYPHFSYQIVEGYDVPYVEAALRHIAGKTAPFTATCSGLGIFTGDKPVLYVRMVRDARLTAFHDELWEMVSPFATGFHQHHYGHDRWIPHITLAMGDLTHDTLAKAVRLLSERTFTWEITIDNVALVLDARGTRDQWLRIPFSG